MHWRGSTLIVAALAAAFFFQALFASLVKSPAWDEPHHIASGLLFLETGRIVRLNDHTPLLREISGLSMRAAGIHLPLSNPDVTAIENGTVTPNAEYRIGNAVLAANGPAKVLFWARLPFILMGTALVFILYGFGRAIIGEPAALGAAFLYAFDPIMISNFSIVYTDAGTAFFVVLFMWGLWAYVRKPGWMRIAWCGVTLGAALASKFPAVILLPVAVVLLGAAALWPPAESGRRPLLHHAGAFVVMCVLAIGIIQCTYLLPADAFTYVKGFRYAHSGLGVAPGYSWYLAGRYASHFQSYFAVALLLKEPLATVILTAVGTVVLIRAKKISGVAGLFLVVPAAAFFVGLSLAAIDYGVRYMAPVLPFTLLAGGAGLAALARGSARWMRPAAALCCLWLVVAAAGIYPDAMSYFNEAACLLDHPSRIGLDGGTRCGYDWLDDTNVDSGQGLGELRAWLDRNAQGRRAFVASLGSTPPEMYGVRADSADYTTILSGTRPGLYAVSALILARAHPGLGSRGGEWLLRARPVAVVGHSIYMYDVR